MQERDKNALYFAAKPPQDAAGILLDKANAWYYEMNTNGYLNKLRMMWAAYHGAYYTSLNDAHAITFSGEQGELSNLVVNHLSNIAEHMINMITATRPAMQARSTNRDYKSVVQTKLANNLLDYYLREKRLENYLKEAVRLAVVLGSGYIKMEWNATSGEVYDFNEELGIEEREGDIEFSNLSPFDVVFDPNREDNRHDWILCRSFKNKFDLAAKYPEYKDRIENLTTKSELRHYYLDSFHFNQTELIPVYEFYHKRSESLPDGRYMLFLDNEIVLIDDVMPYRQLPVYRIAPRNIVGTPYGYTPLFDILPIQDGINSLYSTVLTNQAAFGVQNLLVPKGSDVSIAELSGGLNIVEANMQFGEIKPLQLTATAPETFNFIKMLEESIQTISGINSVTRGNPDPNLKSGNAMALIQSMALQFMSGLQQSYVSLIEDMGTGIINTLRDFASVPRIAMISGKNNRVYMEEFTGDDLSSINRVVVDIGNPLAKCLAKGTEVLMFDGSRKKVEDIIVGDQVMGPDSKSRTVENINTGFENMYLVKSKDESRRVEYGCNESHILTLTYCSDDDRYNAKKGDVIDISVKDYLSLTEREKNVLQGFKVKVEYPEKQLTIPPYILGLWLGDGHSDQTALTTADEEIKQSWYEYASTINMNVRISTNNNCGKANIYFITSSEQNGKSDRNIMLNELKLMEVYKNKHIPNLYLKSSEQQRLQLLAGILDTDGSLVDETFIFTQKNEKLALNVVELAESLGFRVTYKKIAVNTNFKENTEMFKVSIGGDTHKIPTKLERKKAKEKNKIRNWNNYGISVEFKEFGEYYGFTLKEEPHFVLGDFSVTHNTTAGKVEMAEQLLQMGLIKTPEQYMSVIETGRLDEMTDDTLSQVYLVKQENEKLLEGGQAIAIVTDDHQLHIKEHSSVLSNPDLRLEAPELVQRVLAHIQEHINLLRNSDPDLLMMLKQQPLGPQGGSPANPPNNQPPASSMQGQMPEQMGGAPMPTAMQQQGVSGEGIPQPATPPAPFENLPTDPSKSNMGQ